MASEFMAVKAAILRFALNHEHRVNGNLGAAHERAVEIAAYVSSEPGPGGEPLFEWIDVREVMWERPQTTDAA